MLLVTGAPPDKACNPCVGERVRRVSEDSPESGTRGSMQSEGSKVHQRGEAKRGVRGKEMA